LTLEEKPKQRDNVDKMLLVIVVEEVVIAEEVEVGEVGTIQVLECLDIQIEGDCLDELSLVAVGAERNP
jgi:hypothetical protein